MIDEKSNANFYLNVAMEMTAKDMEPKITPSHCVVVAVDLNFRLFGCTYTISLDFK